MPYGEKVREILKEKGMTQRQLADLAGIEESNISYILNSDRNVKETTLRKLCNALDVDPEDIMLEV